MFTNLSLRFRIFLFFCLIALAGAGLMLVALWIGHSRVAATSVTDGFIFSGIISIFGTVALTVAIWLLFDENVAKPIEKLASEMRTRAHAGVGANVDTAAARYLGDLAPAASAVTTALSDTALSTAQTVAAETERLAVEKARLTALLTEIPVAMILVNPHNQIVLYDGQAAEVLSQLGVARLNAPMSDYFDPKTLSSALKTLRETGKEVSFSAQGVHHDLSFDARMKPMDGGGYMLVIDSEHVTISPDAARPLVYDFDLLERDSSGVGSDALLTELTFTVFDTETTGLLPHKDDIVQIGAVRVVNGRIVNGETVDQLVNPGRPIPPASTKVHHVSDAMVADAPDISVAGAQFHRFASGSVIVAHNAPFDMAFLHRDAAKMGVAWKHPILDTVLLSAVLFGASQVHTLDALCDRLDVTIPPELRHTALGDAQATAEVLVRMLPMLRARGLTTFDKVIEETRRHGRLLEDLN